MKCRHCGTALEHRLIDLGSAPPSNAYLTSAALSAPEKWYPLRVLVCETCWLVQTEDFAEASELFDAEYAYFSGFSDSWLAHARRYVDAMAERFTLGGESHVLEVAANDGYLLQYVKARGIPCTGIEPTASTAAAARAKGLSIVQAFFGVELATRLAGEGLRADLTVANNVLAHVPDINDFIAGFAIILKPEGVATFEFPHLQRLIQERQFDTIYHEHFSYLSLTAVERMFAENGLNVFDVEEWPTHGGSLRVFAQRADSGRAARSDAVQAVRHAEVSAGLTDIRSYQAFQAAADKVKDDLLRFLLRAKEENKKVAAYGAAAKGNTLLNYAGVRPDLLRFVVDRNPSKIGKYLPGSRIPIVSEDVLQRERPDYIVMLPWNLADEIRARLAYTSQWGGRLVSCVPELRIWD